MCDPRVFPVDWLAVEVLKPAAGDPADRCTPLPGASSLGFEVRVRAAGVVGGVDHLGDLWYRVQDHRLDALTQGDGGQPAALTAAAEIEVGDRFLHGDKVGAAAVAAIAGLVCASSTSR